MAIIKDLITLIYKYIRLKIKVTHPQNSSFLTTYAISLLPMLLRIFRPVFVHWVAFHSLLEIGHDESFYIMEIDRCYKSGLILVFSWWSRFNEVMERMLIMQGKLKHVVLFAITLWLAQIIEKICLQNLETTIQFRKKLFTLFPNDKTPLWFTLFLFDKIKRNVNEHPCWNYTSLSTATIVVHGYKSSAKIQRYIL